MKYVNEKAVGLCIIITVIIWITTAIGLRSCYPMNTVSTSDTTSNSTTKIEYVFVEVPVQGTLVEKENIKPNIVYQKEIDTMAVKQLQHNIDSLRTIIKNDIRIEWKMDTIHAITKDTISIICEEMNRSILFNFNPSPRQVQVERETITNEKIITRTRSYGIGINAGIGITTDMAIKPVLSFGFNYIIF